MQTISAISKIHKRNGQAPRCARSTEKQNKVSSLGTSANGFLRKKFLPLFEASTNCPDKKIAEKAFFKSFDILAELHHLSSFDAQNNPYPYNVLLAHHFAQTQLCKSAHEIELSIMQDDDHRVKLAGKTVYHTGNTLYYIPVLPLYRLMQDKSQRQGAELLLSVFAYLYHIAEIPYYREDYSALGYHYECLEDWFFEQCQEDQKEEIVAMQQELNRACFYGDQMFRKIYNPYHLNNFKRKIESFTLSTDLGQQCLRIAKKTFEIFKQYPNESIFRNTSNENFQHDDGIIMAQQYISFIADSQGILYENIERAINDEFNECSEMQQPVLFQIYDNQNKPCHQGLDFEYKIFPLINDLCTLLNQMP